MLVLLTKWLAMADADSIAVDIVSSVSWTFTAIFLPLHIMSTLESSKAMVYQLWCKIQKTDRTSDLQAELDRKMDRLREEIYAFSCGFLQHVNALALVFVPLAFGHSLLAWTYMMVSWLFSAWLSGL